MVTCYPRGGYFCSRGPCLNIQPVPVPPHVQDRPSPTPSPQPAPTPKPAAQASALPQTSAILEAMQAQTNAILESQNNILEAIQLTSQPIPAAQTPVEVQAPAQVQPQLDQLVSAVSKLSSGFETLSATVAQQGKILAQLSSGLTTLSQVVAATTGVTSSTGGSSPANGSTPPAAPAAPPAPTSSSTPSAAPVPVTGNSNQMVVFISFIMGKPCVERELQFI